MSHPSPVVGGVAKWLGRRSLAGGLFLTCARSIWLAGGHGLGKLFAVGQPSIPPRR